jgi:hypothetical protein
MLAIADQIRRFNEAQLTSGKVAVQLSYSNSEPPADHDWSDDRIGLVLAIFSTRKILNWRHQRPALQRDQPCPRRIEATLRRLLEAQEEERD